jgi:hypothetical protein
MFDVVRKVVVSVFPAMQDALVVQDLSIVIESDTRAFIIVHQPLVGGAIRFATFLSALRHQCPGEDPSQYRLAVRLKAASVAKNDTFGPP